jgi:ABC-2 type transport system ATP-binding protein
MKGLSISNVSKNYGDVKALRNVSVELQPGKIYGLLGRNGAGKTTLLNIIAGRIFADQGKVLLDDQPVMENDEALKNIFMMSEKNYYPESMRVYEAFGWTEEFYRSFDEKRALELSGKFGLDVSKKIKSLSTGYCSIFKLIIALCVNVPCVFLDEPVLGLDANHRELFYRVLLEAYSENPAAFVISTHLIEEVSGVIEDVIIIHNGEIIRAESREDLLSRYYCVSGSIAAVDRYIAGKKLLGADVLGGLKTACLEGVADRKGIPADLEITKMDLQRLFIRLTNSSEV